MRTRWLAVGAMLCGLALAGPAGAGAVWAWRTDDGGYAFSDDEDAIPTRYRDRAQVRRVGGIETYGRHTGTDPVATQRYEERLAERLDRLRHFNAMVAAQRAGAAEPSTAAPSGDRMILRTGRADAPGIDIGTTGGGSGPVVVETVKLMPSGGAISRTGQVTRRDGEVISVVKSRKRQWDLFEDVYDEDELE